MPQITSIGRIATPPGALDDGAILQVEPMADAIRTLVEETGIKAKKAVTIISGRNVITRFIKLPKMSPKEVASTLKWEADRYIPLSSGTDMLVEHLILGNAEEEATPQINVLLVGVPRKLTYQVYETFTKAGLDLMAVEIEPLSLWRSIGTNASLKPGSPIIRERAFIGLDIGAKASNLAIFQDDELKYSRYIPLAGDDITDSISRATGLAFNAAQEIKERDGELLPGQALDQASSDKIILDHAIRESLGSLMSENPALH